MCVGVLCAKVLERVDDQLFEGQSVKMMGDGLLALLDWTQYFRRLWQELWLTPLYLMLLFDFWLSKEILPGTVQTVPSP